MTFNSVPSGTYQCVYLHSSSGSGTWYYSDCETYPMQPSKTSIPNYYGQAVCVDVSANGATDYCITQGP